MAKNTRRGASRGRSGKQPNRRQVPGWVWLFTGAVAGLFVAFLVHLAHVQLEQGGDRGGADKTPAPAESPSQPERQEADEDDGEPKFDFYAVLPKMEVIVPKGDDEEAPSKPVKEASPAPSSSGQEDDDAPVAGRHDQRFVLQAGSFRNQKDADRRRAELILKGYDVRIQPVKLDNGDTWHRVMIGPYNNINALHRAQDKLAANGVETLPIQLKD